MVRVKTRWILARLDFAEDLGDAGLSTKHDDVTQFPTRKEVFSAVSQSHLQNFGLAATAAAQAIQVRFTDPTTRLVLIRIPREDLARIRSTLTLMTKIIRRRVVISIVTINGSVRTAKRSAIQEIRKRYRHHFLQLKQQSPTNVTRVQCASLEALLTELHAIDF